MPDAAQPTHHSSSAPEGRATASLLVHEAGDHLSHVALQGLLSIEGAQAVETAFTSAVTARRRATIIEVAEVSFLASYAISMIVSASRAVRLRKQPFILVGANPEVDAVLRATRLHQIMSIVATLDEAMAIVAQTTQGSDAAAS